ncbi:alpha/beta fold hydrolase [Streptomyces halstedii]|uniref:alpha/beta fold hydrolase n=1 Tax=Streptomyces TaxID=1883 RepID=UPI0005645E0F|nr:MULTISPECIES: alpha/beta hydrolase [Streptomyces]MCW8218599.1 alpha/beta hydrolase [Streptomyces griseolus]MYQ51189.1 alpha/beta fold hydrolase [Streptomyces sp. SID4941]SCD55834.1 Pimeloyl-ACP methyl ester carboxylesterase [Streptomyces sp. PalvLS-984]SDB94147.1 Pimeloyl-ACP methyl ester carboxylesterase [Streptomyces sp. AmelKG-A3]
MEDQSVVDVGDVRLAYRTWGDSLGSPVVLLHGLGGSSADWEAAGTLLGEEWRVYAVDLRGHGESDWPDEYGFEQMRDDILEFLDACELDRAGVVGHGMGGIVGCLLAEEHPDRVERLVLVETPPPFPPERPAVFTPEGPVDYDENAVPAVLAQINGPDPRQEEDLGQIVAPTMILAGGPESTMPQARLADMASLIPDCQLVTLGGGHRPHLRHPDQVASRITEFFTS